MHDFINVCTLKHLSHRQFISAYLWYSAVTIVYFLQTLLSPADNNDYTGETLLLALADINLFCAVAAYFLLMGGVNTVNLLLSCSPHHLVDTHVLHKVISVQADGMSGAAAQHVSVCSCVWPLLRKYCMFCHISVIMWL